MASASERRRVVLAAPAAWAWVARHVAASPAVRACEFVPLAEATPPAAMLAGDAPCDVLVLRAEPRHLETALGLLAAARGEGVAHCVLIASARVHEPRHGHPGLVSEARLARRRPRNPVARAWRRLERRARAAAGRGGDEGRLPLTILRPTPWLGDPDDAVSRLFAARLAVLVAGHDPSLQILSPADLGEAVRLAVELGPAERTRVFQVAPAGTVPLRRGLELARRARIRVAPPAEAGARSRVAPPAGAAPPAAPPAGGIRVAPPRIRVALPHSWRRVGGAGGLAEAQYLRYSWTVSGEAFVAATGFAAGTSAGALAGDAAAAPEFDDFGQDPDYVARHRLIRFLHDVYWRVEARGAEHVPAAGPAVLVGVHRGFMPWDGVMTLERVRRERGRLVRFLIHPALVKPPYLANFMARLGGVIACRENADRLLARGDVLGIYPEGIRGAFSPYRTAYELKSFGRHDYARLALRHGAPIVPYVVLGSAEIFPILGRLDWRWWQRTMEWPCLPLTPTFPLLPLPLPSKWHMLFLPPIDVARDHPPEAADDPAVVRAVGERVRELLGAALADLRARRRHVFWGSIFDRPAG